LLLGSALLALIGLGGAASGQVKLPEVVVSGAKPKPKPRRVHVAAPAPVTPVTPAAQLNAKANTFDQARGNLYTTTGTRSYTISQDTIDALPQGANASVEKVLLQAPGVSQDSAASGLLHVRNDHANVQYRINGVMLPDGVTGFGSVLDTDSIGSMSLVTGALPAEFGLRTVGLVDITTSSSIFNNSGKVSLYGSSQGTFTPMLEYGGTFGNNCPPGRAGCRKVGTVNLLRGLLCGRPIFFHRPLFADQRGHRKSDVILQPDPRFLAAGKGLRLHVDVRRSDHAPELDRGNRYQHVPDSQQSRPAGRADGQSAGHQRIRYYQFQFGDA
jgi:hypothetical protein